MQEQTPYILIGGESAPLARLCDRFYELMDTVPQFATIRALHPADLQSSRDKLFMFLSGWLGGPTSTCRTSVIRCCAAVTALCHR
jgi:hemoglobin